MLRDFHTAWMMFVAEILAFVGPRFVFIRKIAFLTNKEIIFFFYHTYESGYQVYKSMFIQESYEEKSKSLYNTYDNFVIWKTTYIGYSSRHSLMRQDYKLFIYWQQSPCVHVQQNEKAKDGSNEHHNCSLSLLSSRHIDYNCWSSCSFWLSRQQCCLYSYRYRDNTLCRLENSETIG